MSLVSEYKNNISKCFNIYYIILLVTITIHFTTSDNYYELRIPALGRTVQLGSFYNKRTGTFFKDTNLQSQHLDKLFIPESAIHQASISSMATSLFTVKSTADKFSFTNISDPLIVLDILSGQIQLKGSALFFEGLAATNISSTGNDTVISSDKFPYGVAATKVFTVKEYINITDWERSFSPHPSNLMRNESSTKSKKEVLEIIDRAIHLTNNTNAEEIYFVEEILYGGEAFTVLPEDKFGTFRGALYSDTPQEDTWHKNSSNLVQAPPQNEKEYLRYVQTFPERIKQYDNGRGFQVEYILTPVCLYVVYLKEEMDFPTFSNNTFCDQQTATQNLSKTIFKQLLQTFDEISNTRQKFFEMSSIIADSVHEERMRLQVSNDTDELRKLLYNFDASIKNFKAELRERVQLFRTTGIETYLKEVVPRYEQNIFSPSKVLLKLRNEFMQLEMASNVTKLEMMLKALSDELENVKKENFKLSERIEHSAIKSGAGVAWIMQFSESHANISDCIESGGQYATANNSLRIDVTSEIPPNKKKEIRKLGCLYNIVYLKNHFELAGSSSVIKYIVEDFAGFNEPPNAILYLGEANTGEVEVYNGRHKKCLNLEILDRRVGSLGVINACVRLFADQNCLGENRMFAANIGRWKNLRFGSKTRSIGPCYL